MIAPSIPAAQPPESYSLAEAAAALGRDVDRVRTYIRVGALTGSQRPQWPEPRVTRFALVEFCVAFGITVR